MFDESGRGTSPTQLGREFRVHEGCLGTIDAAVDVIGKHDVQPAQLGAGQPIGGHTGSALGTPAPHGWILAAG